MDQESFRSLLGKSAASSGTSTARASILPARKPATAATATPSNQKTASEKNAFKPRKLNNKFRDRAAERREGINDYAEVEGILEDFEKRNAGADPESAEEQRKYLGGDEEHTILVKGLDFALLEQNRARAATQDDVEAEAALEAAFSGKLDPSSPSVESSTQSALSSTAKPRRTREERIADLKRKRDEARNSVSASSEALPTPSIEDIEKLERAKKMGKFRPIGAPPPEVKKDEPTEKRKKKKRKVTVEAPTPVEEMKNASTVRGQLTQTSTNSSISQSSRVVSKKPNLSTGSASEPLIVLNLSPKTTTPTPPPSTVPTRLQVPLEDAPPLRLTKRAPSPTNDSDEDIFAGAGSYKGLDSDASDSGSDSASESGSETGERRRKRAGKEREKMDGDNGATTMGEAGVENVRKISRWFGDNDPDLAPLLAPPTASLLADPAKAPSSQRSRPRSRSHSPSRRPLPHSDAEDGEEPVPIRLQPLSSSFIPSVKEILELDKQVEAEEKRKARKAKYKSAAGSGTGEPVEKAPKKKLDKDQKLNRDFQLYTSYVEKKTPKGDSSV